LAADAGVLRALVDDAGVFGFLADALGVLGADTGVFGETTTSTFSSSNA
jgi:hypothetical protein